MLLANMSVAKIVADAFPDRALLRRHPPPDERKIGDLLQMGEDLVSAAASPLDRVASVISLHLSAFECTLTALLKCVCMAVLVL